MKFNFFKIVLFLQMIVLFPSFAHSQEKNLTPVITKIVNEEKIFDEIESLGTLKAKDSVILSSVVTEKITAIHFNDGQRVKAGDILIEMNSDEEEADLSAEKAALEEAARLVGRLNSLIKTEALSQSALDKQKRELEIAKARLKSMQSRLQDRVITAPIDGVLGLKNITIGDVLSPGMEITTLQDDSSMKLDFGIPSIYINHIKPNVELTAKSSSFPNKIFTGKIEGIDNKINPETRSMMARAIIDNQSGILKSGLLMNVKIKTNPRQGIIIPEEALISQGKKNYVYTIINSEQKLKAKKQEVVIGSRTEGNVQVTEGLSAGDKIVVHGAIRLSDNADAVEIGILDGTTTIKDILKKSGEMK